MTNRKNYQSTVTIPKNDLEKIIQGKNPVESAKLMVEWGEKIAQKLRNEDLTSSQIRNLFSQVRRIELSWFSNDEAESQRRYSELLRLKPRIAYQAARAGKAVQLLADVLIPAIDCVDGNRDYFQNFVDFFEAILAYHKALGGK